MTTTRSKKPHTHAEAEAPAEQAAPEPIAAPSPAAPPAKAAPLQFVTPPPPETDIPVVPSDFVPVDIAYFVGVLPKGAQLVVMSGAVDELKAFTDYVAVFGKAAPPQASIVQAFTIAYGWSSIRKKVDTFDVYCASQEALAWKEVDEYVGRLQPVFQLAVKSDATIGTDHPSLVRLFNAKKEIAQKGAVTRKKNDALRAEGKPPIKGKVGKRRKDAAAKALYDAANAASSPAAPTAPAASPAVVTAVTPSPATASGGTPAAPATAPSSASNGSVRTN